MPDTLMLIAIILASGLIQGLSGFGFGLFAMGSMALIMPVSDAVVIIAIVTLSSITLNLWSLKDDIPWQDTWPIIIGAAPTTIIGVAALRHLDATLLRMGIAVMILGGCAVSLWRPERALIKRSFPGAHISGFVGGLFGGALNMGGPPVVLYSLLRGWDKEKAKGAMSAYFFVTAVLRVILHVIAGNATWPLVRTSLLLIVPTGAPRTWASSSFGASAPAPFATLSRACWCSWRCEAWSADRRARRPQPLARRAASAWKSSRTCS